MRPGSFEGRLILIRVKVRVVQRREGPEGVVFDHPYYLGIHRLRQDPFVAADEVKDLVEGRSLDLLGPNVNQGVRKLEDVAALLDLLQEESGAVLRRCIWKRGGKGRGGEGREGGERVCDTRYTIVYVAQGRQAIRLLMTVLAVTNCTAYSCI